MISANSSNSGEQLFTLPMVIAVTGHRDLVPAEIPLIKARVKILFEQLITDYPYRKITVMSPLAEGADLLVAEVADELSLDLWVPLPKTLEEYRGDFGSAETLAQFEYFCDKAAVVFDLAQEIPPAPEGFDEENWRVSYPYAALGTFLSAHCHILLAIWDGRESDALGGTAQVVRFHHDDVMEGFTSSTVESQQMMLDDESDLVFHITCSRLSHEGISDAREPAVDWCWYTKDPDQPRARELPRQHELIFQRASEFSQDARQFADQIEAGKWPLIEQPDDERLPEGVAEIDKIYNVADWLAMHYQKKTLRTLLITHWMAFLMGFMFLLYSDFDTLNSFLYAFLAFFGGAGGLQYWAKRNSWQRKYLDYRTLAEGLRVQFYWAVAGVTSESKWKFTHDTFLQSQDPEFGWIRNVMRVAGFRCDAAPNRDPRGLEFAIQEWVGSNTAGQLGYYKRKTREKIERHELTQRLGRLSLVVNVITVLTFILVGESLPELAQSFLFVLMGSTLLLYAVREGYTFAVGTKELIKQFEFMSRIFDNAYQRLELAADDVDKKRLILLALGQSALDEHSDWTLMNRERSLEEKEVWLIGS
jgi:hypothetical protein